MFSLVWFLCFVVSKRSEILKTSDVEFLNGGIFRPGLPNVWPMRTIDWVHYLTKTFLYTCRSPLCRQNSTDALQGVLWYLNKDTGSRFLKSFKLQGGASMDKFVQHIPFNRLAHLLPLLHTPILMLTCPL